MDTKTTREGWVAVGYRLYRRQQYAQVVSRTRHASTTTVKERKSLSVSLDPYCLPTASFPSLSLRVPSDLRMHQHFGAFEECLNCA